MIRPAVLVLNVLLVAACLPPTPVELGQPEGLEQMPSPVRRQYERLRGALDSQLAGGDSSPSQLSGANGRLGMWYHAYRELEPAEQLYRVALAHNPKNGRYHYYLGHLYRTGQRPLEARDEFRAFLATSGESVAGRVWLAEIEESLGETEAAARYLGRAVRLDPRCGRAHDGLGRLAMREGDWEKAVMHFQAALKVYPEARPVAASLAMARHNLGLGPPPPPERPDELGRGRLGHRRLAMNDPLLDELSAMDLRPEACVRRARRLERAGRHEEAAREYRVAVEGDPGKPGLRARLAEALSRSGQPERAVEVLQRAVELWPGDAQLLAGLGMAHARAGETEAARLRLEQALAIDGGSRRILLGLGKLSLGENDLEGALGRFRAAVSAEPEAALPRYWQALVLVRLGSEAEAVAGLEQGLEVARSRELDLALARVLAGAQRRGLRDPERAQRLAGPHRQTLAGAESLAMALAAGGDMEGALAWQRAAVAAAGRLHGGGMVEQARELLSRYQRGEAPDAPGLDHIIGGLEVRVRPPSAAASQSR